MNESEILGGYEFSDETLEDAIRIKNEYGFVETVDNIAAILRADAAMNGVGGFTIRKDGALVKAMLPSEAACHDRITEAINREREVQRRSA